MSLVDGVEVGVEDVKDCQRFGVVIRDCLIRIFRVVCGFAGVYYIGLGSFEYNFFGRRVVLLCVVRISFVGVL